jgi:hypothetical protein
MERDMAKDRSGKSLEQVVGRIQQMMDARCSISYREKIENRLGISREFDVVIRGLFAGHPMLGVIECKDWSDKVGTPELDAFITKTRDINANLRMIVSPKGFTQPALDQAKDAGVGVLSLLPDDPIDAGFSIGVLWYARAYYWVDIKIDLHFSGASPHAGSYKGKDVLYDGKPIVNRFLKELSTTYCNMADTKPIRLSAKFAPPISVTIKNRSFLLSEIALRAGRICQKKKRFMQMTGDAFYNWQTNTLSAPQDGRIHVHGFRTDLFDWDDYDGEIPKAGAYQFIINRFWGCLDLETAEVAEVPNLELVCHRETTGSF